MVFSHNKLRPLAFAISKERAVVYWASEQNMLKWLLNRHDIKADVMTFREDIVATLPLDLVQKGKQDIFYISDLKPRHKNIVSVPLVKIKQEPKDTTPNPSNPIANSLKTSKTLDKYFKPCLVCKNKLNLIEQHKAHKNSDDSLVCFSCLKTSYKKVVSVN